MFLKTALNFLLGKLRSSILKFHIYPMIRREGYTWFQLLFPPSISFSFVTITLCCAISSHKKGRFQSFVTLIDNFVEDKTEARRTSVVDLPMTTTGVAVLSVLCDKMVIGIPRIRAATVIEITRIPNPRV